MTRYREEKDSMGIVRVPATAYYGAQTQRAADNFPVSGLRMPPHFIRSLALIKECAARANLSLGLLEAEPAGAIAAAAREICDGHLGDQFPVDVFQTGSGTSTNMNMNEVVAGRANEILTGQRGGRHPVHPNHHDPRGGPHAVSPAALPCAERPAGRPGGKSGRLRRCP